MRAGNIFGKGDASALFSESFRAEMDCRHCLGGTIRLSMYSRRNLLAAPEFGLISTSA